MLAESDSRTNELELLLGLQVDTKGATRRIWVGASQYLVTEDAYSSIMQQAAENSLGLTEYLESINRATTPLTDDETWNKNRRKSNRQKIKSVIGSLRTYSLKLFGCIVTVIISANIGRAIILFVGVPALSMDITEIIIRSCGVIVAVCLAGIILIVGITIVFGWGGGVDG